MQQQQRRQPGRTCFLAVLLGLLSGLHPVLGAALVLPLLVLLLAGGALLLLLLSLARLLLALDCHLLLSSGGGLLLLLLGRLLGRLGLLGSGSSGLFLLQLTLLSRRLLLLVLSLLLRLALLLLPSAKGRREG